MLALFFDRFMTPLAETLDRLSRLVDWERRDRSGMRVDVAPARDLLERLGRPQRGFQVVHVAGTKGKGSVSALVDAGLRAAGRRSGRYASPHVERVNERITLEGREIADAALAAVLARAMDARDAALAEGSAARDASWFDVWTAAACLAFAEHGVQWAVVECGIGGRLDSTNALDGDIAVLTNVDLEHTALLGNTRAAIARDKLGIVKPGRPLVTGVSPGSEAGAVVEEVVAAQRSRVVYALPGDEATLVETNLAIANAVLGLAGTAPLPLAAAKAVQLPGRMEIVETPTGLTVVLDGAHVPSNLRAVVRDLMRQPRLQRPCIVVLGLARDKDRAGVIEALLPLQPVELIATAHRGSVPPHEPSGLVEAAHARGLVAHSVEPPQAAWAEAVAQAQAEGSWIFVTGSLHLVGDLRAIVRGEAVGHG
jgi:dihydrofolate synthase/folylpolyglutamate synthase